MELGGLLGKGAKANGDRGKNLHEKTGCMVFGGGGVGIYTVSWGILGYTWESREGYVTMMNACLIHNRVSVYEYTWGTKLSHIPCMGHCSKGVQSIYLNAHLKCPSSFLGPLLSDGPPSPDTFSSSHPELSDHGSSNGVTKEMISPPL